MVQVEQTKLPVWYCDTTPIDLGKSDITYPELLALRPWESEKARIRLKVPPALLPDHCPVLTRWVVLTGAPCAGKTTLIKALERSGYNVVHEASRDYQEAECRAGRTIDEIRANDHAFRHHVFKLALDREIAQLSRGHELLFFDRSAVDSLTFHRASGYDPHEILSRLESYRYHKVFQCVSLPFDNDGFRTTNEDRRTFLEATFERDYRALGYNPIRIPFMTVQERVEMILREVLRQGDLDDNGEPPGLRGNEYHVG